MSIDKIINGKAQWHIECANAEVGLSKIPEKTVQVCVTSPPYFGLRNYGLDPLIWGGKADCNHEWGDSIRFNQSGGKGYMQDNNKGSWFESESVFCIKCGAWYGHLGLETLHDCLGWATRKYCGKCYICNMLSIYRQVWKVLRDDGTVWINIGDSYAGGGRGGLEGCGKGSMEEARYQKGQKIGPPTKKLPDIKPKDLIGIPWSLAFALRADGWYLRNDNIWHKNAMPESATDRCSMTHEYIFLLTKKPHYYYDIDAIREAYVESSVERKKYVLNMFGGQPDHHEVKSSKGSVGGGDTGMVGGNSFGANKKTIWRITNEPSNWDYCENCDTLFVGAERKAIKKEKYKNERGHVLTKRICPCGSTGGWIGHYASFPTALPETCIKAGSSNRACEKCGAPWERVPEDQGKTTGWQPTCSCDNKGKSSSIVLDPFSGSARTGLAAQRLGRRYIGIDLNPQYVRISRELMYRDNPLLNLIGGEKA